MSDFDDIPFDQELEGSDDYVSAFPDEDAEEIEAAIFKPVLMPAIDEIQQSLEDLLADAMKQVAKKGEVKGLRKALKRQELSKDERAEIIAKIRSWEDIYEWNTDAYIAMFTEQDCKHCGSDSRFFSGYFYQQHHKTQNCERIVRVEQSEVYAQAEKNRFLPRKIMVKREDVICCSLCVISQGFPYSSIEVME